MHVNDESEIEKARLLLQLSKEPLSKSAGIIEAAPLPSKYIVIFLTNTFGVIVSITSISTNWVAIFPLLSRTDKVAKETPISLHE